MEQKLSDSELLVETLRRQVNESQRTPSNQESERRLSRLQEEHEQEILSLNEKIQDIHMNLQEKVRLTMNLNVQIRFVFPGC